MGKLIARKMFRVCYEAKVSAFGKEFDAAFSFVANLPNVKGQNWPALTDYKTEPIFLPGDLRDGQFRSLKFLRFYRGFEQQREVQKVLGSAGLRLASFEQLALFLHGLADGSSDLILPEELQPGEVKNSSTVSFISADHHWEEAGHYWTPVMFKKVFYISLESNVRTMKVLYELRPFDHQRLEEDKPNNRTFVVAVDKVA